MKLVFIHDGEATRECLRSEAEEGEDEEVDEEALSLCDLPVNFIVDEKQCSPANKDDKFQATKTEEDFEFGSWDGTLSAEMCAADEVFFKGQILPFSSDSGFTRLRHDSRNPSQSIPRSESMDHGSVNRLMSLTSRSSSSGSHISSSSWSSITSITNITRNSNSKPSSSHPQPSLKSQITVSNSQPRNIGNRTQSVWYFFRAGLVRAPEIELQYLKLRNSQSKPTRTAVSRNSSCSSSNSSPDVKIKNQNQRRGFFSGCKCSIGAVETVVPKNNIVVIKSGKKEEEKHFLEVKMKKKTKENEKQKGKLALSRQRTYEWLKELSHSHDADA